jgi:hypothetical protein
LGSDEKERMVTVFSSRWRIPWKDKGGGGGFACGKSILLAAYKRAWSYCGSVTLEGKQHSVVF